MFAFDTFKSDCKASMGSTWAPQRQGLFAGGNMYDGGTYPFEFPTLCVSVGLKVTRSKEYITSLKLTYPIIRHFWRWFSFSHGGIWRVLLVQFMRVFPKIGVFPPKSSILIGFSIVKHPFLGSLIFGNTHELITGCWFTSLPINEAPLSWDRRCAGCGGTGFDTMWYG